MQGQQTDIEIHPRDMFMMRDRLDEILAFHTGETKEEVHSDTERDSILSATEAVEYGFGGQTEAEMVTAGARGNECDRK